MQHMVVSPCLSLPQHAPRCHGQHLPSGLGSTRTVSAKRAEKQLDRTNCLITAIFETAINEIKLFELDPNQQSVQSLGSRHCHMHAHLLGFGII